MKTSTTPNSVDAKNNNTALASLHHSKIPNSFPLATTTHTVTPLMAANAAPNEGHTHLYTPTTPNKYQ